MWNGTFARFNKRGLAGLHPREAWESTFPKVTGLVDYFRIYPKPCLSQPHASCAVSRLPLTIRCFSTSSPYYRPFRQAGPFGAGVLAFAAFFLASSFLLAFAFFLTRALRVAVFG